MSTSKVKRVERGVGLKRLTVQQQIFVSEFLASKTMNGADAARAAGYSHPAVAASKLLKNKIVSAAINKSLSDRVKRTEITAERVLEELGRIAFANPQELFSDDGVILNIRDMTEDAARSLSGFDVEVDERFDEETGGTRSTTTVKPRMWNKLEAIHLLMKHLGMITDKKQVEVNGSVTFIADLLTRVEAKKPSGIVDAESIVKIAQDS